MILQVHDNLFVSDIQDRFSKCFQNHKIEFYAKAHSPKWSKEKHQIPANTRIGDIRRCEGEGCMEIKSWDTVADAEKKFNLLFGLNVHVFKKNGTNWIEAGSKENFRVPEE